MRRTGTENERRRKGKKNPIKQINGSEKKNKFSSRPRATHDNTSLSYIMTAKVFCLLDFPLLFFFVVSSIFCVFSLRANTIRMHFSITPAMAHMHTNLSENDKHFVSARMQNIIRARTYAPQMKSNR